MAEIQRIGLDEVARQFEELEDPRPTVDRLHPLVNFVIIALMAVLAGADGPTGIAKWVALKATFSPVHSLTLFLTVYAHGFPGFHVVAAR